MQYLSETIRKHWGFERLLPMQAQAMQAVLAGQDSVVVLPTGGGKSLCFQAPALVMPGVAVVVSPLIALMKDQVDALRDRGVPAACVNSTMSLGQRQQVANDVRTGHTKLLYLSPEKLMTSQTLQFLQRVRPAFFAIDEAHCISDWGHDFRPEYRSLSILKEQFPGVAIHAYTATATAQVRDDVARELRLDNPKVLVGSFDRPNLVYRVARRTDRMQQLGEVLERHPDNSGIIYCIRRSDAEEICASLTSAGVSAVAYHAGMSDADRDRNQDAFINDRARVIVATVAFGMGIDKSDVRYVIHTGAPKSLEHYQQESGRAGRDGLEAECYLLYSPADFAVWRKLQQKRGTANGEAASELLAGIERFCATARCRHRAIVEYFGQAFEPANCRACDACLDEHEFVPDSLVLAQKILSGVVRLKESYGAQYTAQVLVGSREQRILEQGHDRLSTYGILQQYDRATVRSWIEQAIEQGLLQRTGEYQVLCVTKAGWEVLRGASIREAPRLLKPAARTRSAAKVAVDSWEGVDRGLFEQLRSWRRRKADERGIPPYVVFGDATLRDLARRRPSTANALLAAHGVGEHKLAEYGAELVQQICDYCREHDLGMDSVVAGGPIATTRLAPPNDAKRQAFAMFERGQSVEEVCQALGRARSTTWGYLVDFVAARGIGESDAWVDAQTAARIRGIHGKIGGDRLKPIFDALGGTASYEQIRVVLACERNQSPLRAEESPR